MASMKNFEPPTDADYKNLPPMMRPGAVPPELIEFYRQMQQRRENPPAPPPPHAPLSETSEAQNIVDKMSHADVAAVGVTEPQISMPAFIEASVLHEQIVAELRAQKIAPRNPIQTKADISPPPTGAGSARCGFSVPSLTAPDNIGAGLRGQMEAWVNAVHCPPVPE